MLQKRFLNGVEIISVEIDSLRRFLKDIAEKIKHVHPSVLKIILFGSFSERNFTPFSDIDIAIILKDTEKNFLERQDEFIDYFRGIPFDVNLLIYTEEEFNRMLQNLNNFAVEIEKGIILCK